MESTSSPYLKHLFVCVNKRDPGVTCCAAGGQSGFTSSSESRFPGGGEGIQEKLKAYVKANGLKGKVRISSSGCMDLCAEGPNVMVEPDHRWYHHVTLEDVDLIIQEHLSPLVAHPPISTTAQPQIRAFLFDLGNVLVRFDHRAAAEKIAAHTKTSPEDLYRLFFESPLVVAHDEGRISTKIFYEAVKKQIGLTLPYDRFLWVWNDIFSENQEMENLVKQLLPQYPCFLISNTNRPHFEYCREHYPILNEMTGWILSYEVGAMKPHPLIYDRALKMAKVPAPQIFYVDDREDLIEAAQKLGFQSHRFGGVDLLGAELQKRGILNG